MSRRGRLRRVFLTGLGALLPTVLTIAVVVVAYRFIEGNLARPINAAVLQGLRASVWGRGVLVDLFGFRAVDGRLVGDFPGWIGMLAGLGLVFGTGAFLASFAGKSLWRMVESRLTLLPVVKTIYPYAKQISDFLFEERRVDASHVVTVEYPRPGCWALGFVTSAGLASVSRATGREVVTVFIPTSPTPVTGWTALVPREDVIFLDLSVDEAVRFLVSGGVLVPEGQQQETVREAVEREARAQTERRRLRSDGPGPNPGAGP
ncbi:MAG: DUF502 domain-containing protein [Planctomycetes bacterium]|nr:DUF502 domain-containing protein [Planctomycetota bacterium]